MTRSAAIQAGADFGPVGLFGKHPSTGDFIRAGGSAEAIGALDGWLAAALVAGHRELADWDQRYVDLPPSPFLFNGAAGRVLFGVLVPSADSEGRAFPLALFLECQPAALGGSLHALPYQPMLGEMVTLMVQRGRFAHDELVARALQLALPSSESLQMGAAHYQQFIETTTVGSLFGELLAGHPAEDWSRAIDSVRQAAGSVGVELSPTMQSYGIRCPLGHQPSAHAAFWLDLLQRAGPAGFVPNALWNRYGLLLYCGKLGTRALAALLCPSWQHDSLLDLSAMTPGAAGPDAIDPAAPIKAVLSR